MARRRSLSQRLQRGVTLTAVCLAVATPTRLVAQQPVEDVFVSGPRPLAAAIKSFAKRCRCAISYEDVKWGREQVEESATLFSRVDGTPALIPRGTPFTFTVPRDLSQMSAADIAQSLSVVLGQFESSQNPGQFKIVQGPTSLHVLPAHSAILEQRIGLAVDDTPAVVALQAVLRELGRVSGEEISTSSIPLNLLMQRRVSLTASDEPAYHVLSRLLQAADRRLSLQLVFEVTAKRYFLSVYSTHQ